MMWRSSIPNLLTMANLASGVMAIVYTLYFGQPVLAVYWIGAALVFDLLDGAVARALGVDGELGKQLDSLADVVSFGVVPGIVLFRIAADGQLDRGVDLYWLSYVPLSIPLFAAYRLATFNIDTRQKSYFIGLPTPAAAIFLLSLPLILHFQGRMWITYWLTQPLVLAVLSLTTGLLMVSGIPLLSMKKGEDGRFSPVMMSVLALGALSIFAFRYIGIPIVILLYLVLSILFFKPNEVHRRN